MLSAAVEIGSVKPMAIAMYGNTEPTLARMRLGAIRTLVDPSFIGDSPFGRCNRFAARILRNQSRQLRAHFVVLGEVLAAEPLEQLRQQALVDRSGAGDTQFWVRRHQRLLVESQHLLIQFLA